MSVELNQHRGIEWRLFLAAFLAFAFFHQGGGWNQNARFAMARAVVEENRFSIDSYLFYSGVEQTEHGPVMLRTPIIDGGFTYGKRDYGVHWNDADGTLVWQWALPRPDAPRVDPVGLLDDGDGFVLFYDGRYVARFAAP